MNFSKQIWRCFTLKTYINYINGFCYCVICINDQSNQCDTAKMYVTLFLLTTFSCSTMGIGDNRTDQLIEQCLNTTNHLPSPVSNHQILPGVVTIMNFMIKMHNINSFFISVFTVDIKCML